MAKRPTGTTFMVSCTPPKKQRCSQTDNDYDANEGNALLRLAPFQPQPKLVFKNIKVGSTATREVVAENPLQKGIEILLEFTKNEKISTMKIGQWTLSHSNLVLCGGESKSIKVTWSPEQAGEYHVIINVKQLLSREATRKISSISITATSIETRQIKDNKKNVKPLRDRNVITNLNKNVDASKEVKQKTPKKVANSFENDMPRTYIKNKSNTTFDASQSLGKPVNLFASMKKDCAAMTPDSDLLNLETENSADRCILQSETDALESDVTVSESGLEGGTFIVGSESRVLQNETIVRSDTFVTDEVNSFEHDFENDSLDGSFSSSSFRLSSFNSFEKQLNDINFRSTLDGTIKRNIVPSPSFINNEACLEVTGKNCIGSRVNLSPLITTDQTRNYTYTVENQLGCDFSHFVIPSIEIKKEDIAAVDKSIDCEGFRDVLLLSNRREVPSGEISGAHQDNSTVGNVPFANYVELKKENISDNMTLVNDTQSFVEKSQIIADICRPSQSQALWCVSPPKRIKIVEEHTSEESPVVLPTLVSWGNKRSRPSFKTGRYKLPKARLCLKRKSSESGGNNNSDKKSPSPGTSSFITVSEEFLSNRPEVNYSKNPFSEIFISFMDARYIDELEKELLKWVNVMLSPPLELEAVSLMPTGRQILNFSKACIGTSTAHTIQLAKAYKLQFVRKAGRALLMSNDVTAVLKKVATAVENGLITIRPDKDVHQDIGLQEIVLKLLLCYHPLWLRIALETIYDQSISLNSNSDIAGIVIFIRKHLLSDNYLKKKYSHPTVPNLMKPNFQEHMKKFILKKFLMVIYFLDIAKTKKLIRHDPCLFCINSPYKTSTAILLEFNKEFIKGGDNSRYLATFGFKLLHKQTSLEEFNLKLSSRDDLRDGIRLTRLIEIIINCEKGKLYNQLKAPALSRYQKMNNNKVAFNAFRDSGHHIDNNVTEVDFVNGHREKILSFLWQLKGTTLTSAVVTIQMFWKKHKEMIKQRKAFLKTKEAVTRIQTWYRGKIDERNSNKNSNTETSSKIDSSVIMKRKKEAIALAKQERAQYIALKNATVNIQRRWRAMVAMRKDRANYLKLKVTVKVIESLRESKTLGRKVRASFVLLKAAVICIQKNWKAYILMRKCRTEYLQLKLAVSVIESRREAIIFARKQRAHFAALKIATVNIQRKWRSILFMRKIRILLANKQYMSRLKSAVMFVETKRKAIILKREMIVCSKERSDFVLLKIAAITIQRKWRSILAMRKCRSEYFKLKLAVARVESQREACILARKQRTRFVSLKSAAISIQRKYRATLLMRELRSSYLKLKWAVSIVKSKRAALKNSRKERIKFILLKSATVTIQRRWRATLTMQRNRTTFLKLKDAVSYVETRRAATIACRKDRIEFIALKGATLAVQKRWRALLAMRENRKTYLQLKNVVSFVESKRIATVTARKIRSYFIELKSATVTLQRKWRALLAMRRCRNYYLHLKRAVLFIESKRVALITSRKVLTEFNSLKRAAIILQRNYRATLLMRECRSSYLKLKWAVSLVESKRLASIAARKCRTEFIKLQSATIDIQRRWRATVAMRKIRTTYLQLKWAVTFLKSRRLAIINGRKERADFIALKKATLVVQRKWRSTLFMRKIRTLIAKKQYLLLLISSVKLIETKRKATVIARKERAEFIALKSSVLTVQRNWRGILQKRKIQNELREQRAINLKRNEAAKKIQSLFREYLVRKRNETARLNNAATKIQAFWRGFHLRRRSTMILKRKFKPLQPGKTLGEMRIGIINKLRSVFSIQTTINYLSQVEFMTTFSSQLANDLVQDGLVEVLFKLLSTFTRNLPDQKAKLLTYKILVNLTKICSTCDIVWKETFKNNVVNTVLSDCLNFCKNNEDIFCACVTLLWLWSFDKKKLKVITKDPKFDYVIKRINKELPAGAKGKLKSVKPLLPSRKPNCGMDNKKSGSKLFDDSFFAWKSLLDKFENK